MHVSNSWIRAKKRKSKTKKQSLMTKMGDVGHPEQPNTSSFNWFIASGTAPLIQIKPTAVSDVSGGGGYMQATQITVNKAERERLIMHFLLDYIYYCLV
jgi:hypothetical protein